MTWQPTASLETLKLRAQWLREIRAFFQQREVLEVETPILSPASIPDPNIESLCTEVDGQAAYLQTSPELYMKRLLAAGSGPIYQISRVFRDGEKGRLHNPEFTLVEWYRPGYSQQQLMSEVHALLSFSMGSDSIEVSIESDPIEISYRELFEQGIGINPLQVDWFALNQYCDSIQLQCPAHEDDGDDAWAVAMDWLLSVVIQPDMQGVVFVTDYPATQASLARFDPENPAVARRFELFIDGIEMANGFEELTDAEEQRRRFAQENSKRQASGQQSIAVDEAFLAALESGLPETSGVALGLDRLLMWRLGMKNIQQVMSFAWRDDR